MTFASKLRCLRGMSLPVLALLAAIGCARASESTTNTLSGIVANESGAPIAGATVVLVGSTQSVTTNSAGAFSFTAHSSNPNASVLGVSASGYAPQYRNYHWSSSPIALGVIQLRTVSVSQEVTLPASPNETVGVSSVLGDGGARVAFGYQSLVNPQGVVAQGNVTVNLTYWHPQGDLQSIPGALIAVDANGPSPLRTYGMISVDVHQGEDELQVAPGQTATLFFTTPGNMLATMLNQTVPNLYWLDPEVGQWRSQAAAGDGNLSLDPNSGVFTARVPHLSEWNMDGTYEYENGGCITGHVANTCSPTQGAANTAVSVWFLGLEQLKRWDTVTDGSGSYCINVGIGPYQGAPADARGFPISYMVTSTSDITQPGTMCDPLPQECRTCDPAYATYSYPPCNNCVIQKPGQGGYTAPGQVVGPVYADCNPPTPEAYIAPCHFCPGTAPSQCANYQYNFNTGQNTESPSGAISGGCFALQTITLRVPGCTCVDLGAACQAGKDCCPGPSGAPSVCSAAGTCVACNKVRGQTCASTDGCCDSPPVAGEVLECSDNVCVPNRDPQFEE